MTSNRMSMIFRPEGTFKDGGSGNWYAPPPGTTWTDSYTITSNKVNALGAKAFEAVSYGKMTGTFNWKFTLDYDFLEPLCFAYEAWQENKCLDNEKSVDPITQRFRKVVTKDQAGCHIFYKTNSSRVKSFAARVVTLHRPVNPDSYDEVRIIRGCKAKGAEYAQSSGNSQVTVSLSGSCAGMDIYYVYADTTDYQPYSGESLVEWACFLMDGEEYVKTVESLSFKTTTTIDDVYSTCGPMPQNYTEGGTTYQMSITAYTDDYNKFKTRVLFSGGDVFSGDYADIGTKPAADEEAGEDRIIGKKYTPATRGRRSMKRAVIQSSTTNMVAQSGDQADADNGMGDNGDGASVSFGGSFSFDGSDPNKKQQEANAVKVTMYNGVVTSSAEWKGDANSKLTESLNMDGTMMVLEFMTGHSNIWRNVVRKDSLAVGTWGKEATKINTPITLPDTEYNGCPKIVPVNPMKFTFTQIDSDECD